MINFFLIYSSFKSLFCFNFNFIWMLGSWLESCFFYKKLSNYTTVNMVIGMSIILFIGGILNYFNLAYEIIIKIIFY